jgi:hypothetical protein
MEPNVRARVRKSQRLVPDPSQLSPYSNLKSVIFLNCYILPCGVAGPPTLPVRIRTNPCWLSDITYFKNYLQLSPPPPHICKPSPPAPRGRASLLR